MEDDGNFVSMRGLKLNLIAGTGNSINFQQASGLIAAGLGYSSIGAASSTGIKFYLDQNVTTRSFVLDTTTITSDTERTYSMPNSSGTLALTSDIPSLTGYVPYTGATTNLDLGTHTLSAYNLIIDHTSGSGVAASITKGGNGEALTVVKSSGSGNAASITGGVTLLSELHLTTDLADAYIASATNWNTAYSLRITSATSPLSITSNVISIAQASGSTNGYLSSTDWTTFNNKQNALTNPVTGTGTTNYLPKFTGASTIGNSIVQDNGSTITIGGSLTLSASSGFPSVGLLNRSSDTSLYMVSAASGFILLDNSQNTMYQATPTSHNWNISNSLKMKLDASGNLGIGTSSPAYKLQVSSTAAEVMRLQGMVGNVSSNNTQLRFYGSASAADLWAIGTEVSTGSSGRAFDFYDLVAGANRMRLDASGNLGLGVVPSAWANPSSPAFQIKRASLFSYNSATTDLGYNLYFNGSDYIYIANDEATLFRQQNGAYEWYSAPSGTAGNAISFTQAMTLNASGNLLLGGTTDYGFKANIVHSGDGLYLRGGSTSGATPFVIANGSGTTIAAINGVGAATFSSSVTVGAKTFIPSFTSGGALYMKGTVGETAARFWYLGNDVINYGDLAFGVSAANSDASYSAKMILTSAGNVGIGITNPSSYYANQLVVSGGFEGGITIASTNTTNSNYLMFADGTSGTSLYSGYIEYSHTSNYLNFATNATSKMIILSSGNVGIGTTSPSYNLDVSSNVNSENTIRSINLNSGAAATARIYVENNIGSLGQFTTYSSGFGFTVFGLFAGNYTALLSSGASSAGLLIGSLTADPVIFGTDNSERMRITSGGNLLGNKTVTGQILTNGFEFNPTDNYLSICNSTSANYSLYVANTGTSGTRNMVAFYDTSSLVGSITYNGTITAYNITSDYRLKTDFKDYNGLDLVNKIKTYDYEWKADKSRGYGVIAHELQSVINYAVTGVKDGKEMQQVDYSKIVPVLIKAIQELNDKIK
jgi:hypothetical protein